MGGQQRERREHQWDADKVRALREHLGLTQRQLSEELGTRQQTISEWERGIYRPRGASRTVLRFIAERAGFEYRATPLVGEEGESSDQSKGGA
ncbi:MAG: helix-turn-helix transcriptional regulator [Chloroflexi bacterium]|nr:helix-turn-helix transcriptional regulator [Chloroflexota bacterium]